MTVEISRSLHARLLALAAAEPDHEVCGLLLGGEGRIEAIVEARNVADEPARTFEIDPRAQIDAVRAAREGGLPVIGCYHSHPGGDVAPSRRDTELATADSLWLVVAQGTVGAWHKAGQRFVPLELRLTTD